MKNTSTPPDMTRVHAAELQQLRKNLSKVEADINREEMRLAREIGKVARATEAAARAIQRKAEKDDKILRAQQKKALRPINRQLTRIRQGRAPGFAERAAIARRIAVLEGRLAS